MAAGSYPLELSVERTDNRVSHVVLRGELDLSTSARVMESVEAVVADSDCVVLDLHGLTYLDSSGIKLLLDLAARAEGDAGS